MHTFSSTMAYIICYLSLFLTNTQNTICKNHFGINVCAITVNESRFNTPIPHRPRIPQIDKYLDSWLNRIQFVKILTDSHSP